MNAHRLLLPPALALLVAWAGLRAADPWSSSDVNLEVLYATTLALDWAQTRDIARQPHCFREQNGMMRKHPSAREVDVYFLASLALHVAVVHHLPRRLRPYYQLGTVAFEVAWVRHNFSMGIRVAF